MQENHSDREVRLPCFGIRIRLARGNDRDKHSCGTISSDLKQPARDDDGGLFNAAIDGLESLILAHACAGVDVESAAYVDGVQTAFEAIANNV